MDNVDYVKTIGKSFFFTEQNQSIAKKLTPPKYTDFPLVSL